MCVFLPWLSQSEHFVDPWRLNELPPCPNTVDNLCHDVFITRQGIRVSLELSFMNSRLTTGFRLHVQFEGGEILNQQDTSEDISESNIEVLSEGQRGRGGSR